MRWLRCGTTQGNLEAFRGAAKPLFEPRKTRKARTDAQTSDASVPSVFSVANKAASPQWFVPGWSLGQEPRLGEVEHAAQQRLGVAFAGQAVGEGVQAVELG